MGLFDKFKKENKLMPYDKLEKGLITLEEYKRCVIVNITTALIPLIDGRVRHPQSDIDDNMTMTELVEKLIASPDTFENVFEEYDTKSMAMTLIQANFSVRDALRGMLVMDISMCYNLLEEYEEQLHKYGTTDYEQHFDKLNWLDIRPICDRIAEDASIQEDAFTKIDYKRFELAANDLYRTTMMVTEFGKALAEKTAEGINANTILYNEENFYTLPCFDERGLFLTRKRLDDIIEKGVYAPDEVEAILPRKWEEWANLPETLLLRKRYYKTLMDSQKKDLDNPPPQMTREAEKILKADYKESCKNYENICKRCAAAGIE